MPALSSTMLDTGRIAWREAGEGRPLVLLHGLGACAEGWLPQFARFSRSFRVIAVDCPGYGGSAPLPEREPDAEAYVRAVAALLDALAIPSAHIVGDWLGAVIAAGLAARHPERVDFLVLSGARIKPSEEEAADYLTWLQQLLTDRAGFGARFADRVLAAGADPAARGKAAAMAAALNPLGFGRACHMLGKTDNSASYAAIRTPTLLLYGERDAIAPASEARSIERLLPGAVTEVIAGAGHAPALERPDLFNTAVQTFMRTATLNGRAIPGPRRVTA